MCMIFAGFLSSAERLELEACVRRQRVYLDDDTIRGWYKTYRDDGWDALALNGCKGGHSQMTHAQEAALCAWLEERFCRSTVEIRAHISAEFEREYSHSGCIKAAGPTGFRVPQAQAIAAGCISRKADSLHRFIRKADARIACG